MTEEQIKAKKIFAGEKKTSMKRRDDCHDYMERRMYMITLEVEGRMCQRSSVDAVSMGAS